MEGVGAAQSCARLIYKAKGSCGALTSWRPEDLTAVSQFTRKRLAPRSIHGMPQSETVDGPKPGSYCRSTILQHPDPPPRTYRRETLEKRRQRRQPKDCLRAVAARRRGKKCQSVVSKDNAILCVRLAARRCVRISAPSETLIGTCKLTSLAGTLKMSIIEIRSGSYLEKVGGSSIPSFFAAGHLQP